MGGFGSRPCQLADRGKWGAAKGNIPWKIAENSGACVNGRAVDEMPGGG